MERVDTFFEANDVEEDAKKHAVFLTSVGRELTRRGVTSHLPRLQQTQAGPTFRSC